MVLMVTAVVLSYPASMVAISARILSRAAGATHHQEQLPIVAGRQRQKLCGQDTVLFIRIVPRSTVSQRQK
ncbi:hypothetical protein HC231_05140 [Brenneria izadpanahii]|uniref:Secreted protein n=1 Tax=Brenneria izadpanahii TaxID=2722756 RepID=A0ABX7US21_9GAMM|nr:hypothetical protein HC231_05140 [Brenneria izadpanahii]